MLLYNTLTRQKEEFTSIIPHYVGMYCCGPTVYDYQHIGNLRTYIFEDILKRVLKHNGYKVKHIINITDIGHLVSDADEGEDKMMKALRRENLEPTKKSMKILANKYTKAFKKDLKKLNIQKPNKWTKATKHIKNQIKLVQILIDKRYTYETSDGIYFDTTKYSEYGKLSLLDKQELKAGKRIDLKEKKDIHDFALWKFSKPNEKRVMEWKAFNKKGFPGWHIECSAMSMKYLGNHFDIHCGGIDHIPVHHTNERAQNNCAVFDKEKDKEVVNFWIHGEFLVLDKSKMAKSAGSFITLQTLIDKGINPIAYRYFCLTANYGRQLTFDWQALDSAQAGLKNLQDKIIEIKKDLFSKPFKNNYNEKFINAVNNDLNIPEALSIVWELIKDKKLGNKEKYELIMNFDKVLGLDLNKVKKQKINIPFNIKELADKRLKARAEKNWEQSDKLRDELNKLGWIIEDTDDSYILKKK